MHKIKLLISCFAMLTCTSAVQAQQTQQQPQQPASAAADSIPFTLLHGPYLQEVTTQAATVVYEMSSKAFTWVEVKPHGSSDSQARRCINSRDGLLEADNAFGSVRIKGLEPAHSYDYRIISKQMLDFKPYKVTYGDSIATPWYTFSTINPAQQGATIFVTSDIHNETAKLERLLDLADYKTCNAFFYAGDMVSYISNHEAPFKAFIDPSVKRFASSIPFEVVRGNHETRGNLARSYSSYFPKENGKIYGSYRLGDVMVVMLDSGEDKEESHWAYSGLTDFNAYRTEQAEWLRQLIKSKEYKTARYRIIICHFPLVMDKMWQDEKAWWGWDDAIRKFLPVLNEAKVDLMVSGHSHRFFYHECGADNNRFPILEQGYDSATRLELHDGKIHLKVIDINGQVLKECTL